MHGRDDELKQGEVRRRELLGTEAVYRVIAVEGDGLVRVSVIDAPGLPKGRELRFSAEDVTAMELAPDLDERPAGAHAPYRRGGLARGRPHTSSS